jgi:F420-non-reducing hydrogenase iron-sulfur subunit
MSWDPQILVFACNWCSYGGADAAGVSRFQYPPDVQIVRVMCSGRVDPGFVLRAFNKGADGVLITGCHPNVITDFVGKIRKLGPANGGEGP